MRMMALTWLASGLSTVGGTFCLAAQPAPGTQPAPAFAQVRAEVRADHPIQQADQPLWVTFTLTNLSPDPVLLRVPDVPATDEAGGEMGLPLPHVFSGLRYNGLTIRDARGDEWDQQVEMRPAGPVPVVRLAPFGCVGTRADLTRYYPSLKRPGKYTLIWRPYFGQTESPPLHLILLAERQAIILTEFGSMTMRFYYKEAPNAVQNFIELVEQRFYDGLTFHKIVPHSLVQGGDPRNDGRGVGVRPDGKRLKAEFSSIPFTEGTVGMARLPRDPDSASCQFFICASRQTALDGNETAFGYLVGEQSFETLRKIAAVPTDGRFRPRPRGVTIRNISLENVPAAHESLDPAAPAPNRPLATRPAIMDGTMRNPHELSRSDGRVPSTQPSSIGG